MWKLFNRYCGQFEEEYEQRYAERFGPLRPAVKRVVAAYLRCGLLEFGFARIRCPECREEYLLPFSCKTRCLCPSCHKKRQLEFGEFVAEEILEAVPHRHVVLSIPRRLRPFFRRNRGRLAKLSRAAWETVREVLQVGVGERGAVPGGVACIQTFGNLLDFHPHVHLLVSWGVFQRDGTFVAAQAVPSAEELEKLFRHRVLRMLLDEGAIDQKVVDSLLSWTHTGFGGHVGEEIPASDKRGREEVARYMAHPPVVLGRILMEEGADQVVYRSEEIHPRHGANFRVFDPVDFIAEVVAHIPDGCEKTALYYGWYSNRTRGDRRARGQLRPKEEPKQHGSGASSEAARRRWAELIRRIYEVDPLVCRKCGTEMKVIAVIDRPQVIEKILRHLKLWSDEKGDRAPPVDGESARAEMREFTYEPFQEGLPFAER